MASETTQFSAKQYFETQPAPASLQDDILRVREFVLKQKEAGRKVVLITVSSPKSLGVEHIR